MPIFTLPLCVVIRASLNRLVAREIYIDRRVGLRHALERMIAA